MFLHGYGVAKDTPEGITSPAGLFGNTLTYLMENEHHRHANHGPSGMVYWSVDTLKRIAPLEKVIHP